MGESDRRPYAESAIGARIPYVWPLGRRSGEPNAYRMDQGLLMIRDRDRVFQAARNFLLRGEEVDRKVDLAVGVHEADVAYLEAVRRLSDAYQAALEGGWSTGQLSALGFTRPQRPKAETEHPIRIARRRTADRLRADDGRPG